MNKNPRHIAVNARFLLPGKTEGLGRYSEEVLKRLVNNHPDTQFSFFFDRPFDKKYLFGPNVKPYVLRPPARHPILWKIWFDFSVRRKLAKLKPDVFFSPDGFACLHTSIPQVIVIHDLAFEHVPEDTHASHSRFYRRFFPQYAKIASQILTVSEFTRRDIVERYGISFAKITVAGNAAASTFFPVSEDLKKNFRDKYAGGKPYFHYAGAIQPRKNLEVLFEAFARFRKQTGLDVKLLLAGRKAWKFEGIEAAYENSPVKEHILFTGYISDEELNLLYNSSWGLFYPSRFEGFGLPLVEAMQCGCPVVTSDKSSLPEVAGNAGIIIHPENLEEIQLAMTRLATEPQLREQCTRAGLERSKLFSWDTTAAKVWQSLCL